MENPTETLTASTQATGTEVFCFPHFSDRPLCSSDCGYELIMCKAVPLPSFFFVFLALFTLDFNAHRAIIFNLFEEISCELFLLLASRSLDSCMRFS